MESTAIGGGGHDDANPFPADTTARLAWLRTVLAADRTLRSCTCSTRSKGRRQRAVGDIMVDPTKAESFTHSLHASYSGLNKTLELPFARDLDDIGVTWCRNPSRSGFGIPLLSPGQSQTFYPDFLAWKGKHVFALDTKGEHILESELGRKLLAIEPNPKAKPKLLVRLISKGNWDDHPQRVSADGFTLWALGHANVLKPIHCATMAEAVRTCLRVTL